MSIEPRMKMYSDLAEWWPLLSPASEYLDEIEDLLPEMLAATRSPRTLLELGCGGGSLAHHLKDHFKLTLTDVSPAMLEVSRRINPECEHLPGDMRTLDLGRSFDLVLIHDAIMYMTRPESLNAALRTACRHLRPGGAAFFVPDHVKETYEPRTDCGGYDGPDGRGLRYLEWSWDPDPGDQTFEVAYAFLLRDPDGHVSVEHDHHVEGLFPRESWLGWMRAAGFTARSRMDPYQRDVFVGIRGT